MAKSKKYIVSSPLIKEIKKLKEHINSDDVYDERAYDAFMQSLKLSLPTVFYELNWITNAIADYEKNSISKQKQIGGYHPKGSATSEWLTPPNCGSSIRKDN